MACQKTVVDFTLMSDAEIIHYFSKASGSVCGRVGSDQLNRKLEVPRPPRKSPWMGWPVLLSGLLFTSDETGSHRVVGKTAVHQCERPAVDGLEHVMQGMMMRLDTSAIEQVGERHDTMEVIKMGEMMGDVVMEVEPPPVDTVRVAVRREEPDSMVYNGGINLVKPSEDAMDRITRRADLTRWSRNVFDTVKQIVADSLMVVGVEPQADSTFHADGAADRGEIKSEPVEMTVYPNPVLRGGSLNLSWKGLTEDGRVNLYSIGGVQIQSWMIQGGSTMRTLTMPADIAAGVYILQVITKDGGYTRKVVVE